MPTYKERALAAEKTVAILKAKVQALYNGQESQIQRQQKRAQERQAEAQRREQQLQERAVELQRYSKRLELEIEQRTQEINTILNHVNVGFLMLDEQGIAVGHCSKSCHTLLGKERIIGCNWGALIGLDHAADVDFQLNLYQLFEDLMPEELSLQQLPWRFPLRDDLILHARGSLIRGDYGEPLRLLMTIYDGTELELAQRESVENKLLVQLLNQRPTFVRFLADVRLMLEQAHGALSINDHVTVRRMVHTIKGNAGSFSLHPLVELIHAIESSRHISAEDLVSIEVWLRSFLERYDNILDIDYDSKLRDSFEITHNQLQKLRLLAARRFNADDYSIVESWTQQVTLRPALDLLGPVESFVERLGERLGKQVRFHAEGLETHVSAEQVRPLFQSITHVLRNSIDHGIEHEDARGDKPSYGTVSLVIEDLGDDLLISVGDDGRGVDVEKLSRRALERGLVDAAQLEQMSEQERLFMLFWDNVSTAEQITEISGRGVGMSAFKAAVDASLGQLSIINNPGHGVTFQVRLVKKINPMLWDFDTSMVDEDQLRRAAV